MDAKAIDILGRKPPLDLADYNHVEINGLAIEVRDGVLTIRNPNGRLLVRPVATNSIEIEPETRAGRWRPTSPADPSAWIAGR